MWFWHQNWAIWQFYASIDLDRVLARILFRLICGCEDWLVTDAKKQQQQTGLSTAAYLYPEKRTWQREGGLNSFPTLAIPWVHYMPCETTNLSKSGLPSILLPRTNGEERGSHSRGAFPQSCHTSLKKKSQRGGGSKDQIIVPFSQLHPLTHSETGLQLAF